MVFSFTLDGHRVIIPVRAHFRTHLVSMIKVPICKVPQHLLTQASHMHSSD
jgi:hypothetical protein